MSDRAPGGLESGAAWAGLVSNSHWNFAAFAIVVVVNFVTLPYVVHRLGMAQFGLAGIVLAVLAPLMFVGAVVAQACVREIAPMLEARHFGAARHVLSAALALCAGASVPVLLALGLAGPALIGRITGARDAVASADMGLVVVVAGFGWAMQQLFQVLQATIVSAQRFRALAGVNVVSALLSAACLLSVTWIVPTVLGFACGTTLGLALTLLLTIVQARRYAGALFPLAWPRLVEVRRILAFCRWQVPAHVSGALALQTDRYLLGATAALPVVGQFNVAMRLQEVVYMGVLKIGEVLFPHFSASAGSPAVQQAKLFLASSWIVNTIAAAALAPLIPLSAALIDAWVGPSALELGAPMLRTLVSAGIVGSGINVFTYFALGHGHTRRLGVMSLVHAATVVLSSAVLILGWGALAAGLGFLVANAVRLAWATWVTPALVGGRAGMVEVVQATLLPLASGLLVGWGWCLGWPLATDSWLVLALCYGAVASLVLLLALGLGAALPQSRTLVRGLLAGVQGHLSNR